MEAEGESLLRFYAEAVVDAAAAAGSASSAAAQAHDDRSSGAAAAAAAAAASAAAAQPPPFFANAAAAQPPVRDASLPPLGCCEAHAQGQKTSPSVGASSRSSTAKENNKSALERRTTRSTQSVETIVAKC